MENLYFSPSKRRDYRCWHCGITIISLMLALFLAPITSTAHRITSYNVCYTKLLRANVIVNRWEAIAGTNPPEYEYHLISAESSPGANDGYPYGSILATVNTEVTPVHYHAFGQTMYFPAPIDATMPYYDVNQWCEGAVNVSALFGLTGNECLTVSTVFIRTRTSGSSGQSQLKDIPGLV